jgi:hypothetical protein
VAWEQTAVDPHITIAYSTAPQPAEPIMKSLRLLLPERKVQISQVSLVVQRGPECNWDWHPEATVHFGAARSSQDALGLEMAR